MLLFARFLDIRVELLVQYYSHFQNSLELQKTARLAFCVQPTGKILSYSFSLKMMRRFTFGNVTRQPREFKDTCPGILSPTYKKFQLPAIRDITKGYFQEHTFKKSLPSNTGWTFLISWKFTVVPESHGYVQKNEFKSETCYWLDL